MIKDHGEKTISIKDLTTGVSRIAHKPGVVRNYQKQSLNLTNFTKISYLLYILWVKKRK